MFHKGNSKLITKVLIVGTIIAVLSYLFHPEVGRLSVFINGQPVTEPIVRIAAIPTFLLILGLAIFLTIMLLLGFGVFMFLGALFFALVVCIILAPYFWPVLVVIMLVISVLSISHDNTDA